MIHGIELIAIEEQKGEFIMINKKIEAREISAETMEHIIYKASCLRSIYQSSGKKKAVTLDMMEMFDCFLSIIEDLDLWDDVITERTYYVLPCDNYGQPTGDIIEQTMTKAEALETPYCYEDYDQAMARAMD